MRIPNYTKGLVLERATPNQVNLGQIEAAGAEFGGAAQLLDLGGQVRKQMEVTNSRVAANSGIISKKTNDIEARQGLQEKWQDSPIGYAKAAQDLYKERDEAILESLPDDAARRDYKLEASKVNLLHFQNDTTWEVTRSAEVSTNKADQSIRDLETMAFRGTPLEELKRDRQETTFSLGGVLAQDQLVKFDEKAEQRIVTASIEGLIDRNPYEAKEVLDSREYDSALGVDKLSSLTTKAEKAIIAQEKADLALEERNDSFAMVGLALDGKAILDPFDKDTKKAVDTYYQEFTADLQTMPPQERLQAQLEFVSKVGVYPPAMESAISAQLNNGSAEQKIQAAEFIDSVAVNNPSTALQINESQRARARSIVSGINAGLQPAKAVEQAEANAFRKDTPEYKQRLENFTRKGGEKVKFKEGDFTEFFRRDPGRIPDSMQADWELLNQNYYMEGMDASEAAKLATDTVKSQWSITNADGSNRWMKYSPESVYGNDAGSDWIKGQLEHDISQIPSFVEQGKKLYLAVDPRTIKSPNKAYQVFHKDDNGALQPYFAETGEQAIFVPDFKESPAYKKLLEEFNGDAERAMERAIMFRDVRSVKEEKRILKRKRKVDRSRALMEKVEGLFDADN